MKALFLAPLLVSCALPMAALTEMRRKEAVDAANARTEARRAEASRTREQEERIEQARAILSRAIAAGDVAVADTIWPVAKVDTRTAYELERLALSDEHCVKPSVEFLRARGLYTESGRYDELAWICDAEGGEGATTAAAPSDR